jgi:ABC-type transport system involved in multi-copper enzyme maturation permease subunit
MNVLPVVERELRTQARQSFTYVLRVIGVVVLLFVCFTFSIDNGFSAHLGGKLFGYINLTLFCSIWIMVPPLAADCISREKREGTLGLLFLTPLKARDIVLAKGLAHGLRAFTLWAAIIPVMTIPFLLGGVSWHEAVMCCLVNFSALCWALAAGILASSAGKAWLRCLLLAYAFGLMFFCVFGYLNGQAVFSGLGGAVFGWGSRSSASVPSFLALGVYYASDFDGGWGQRLASISVQQRVDWLRAETVVTVLSFLGLFLSISLAGWPLRRGWQEKPPSKQQVWAEKTFCTPVFGVAFLRRWMRRKLEANPIGWLEQRTWSGRLVTWGWFSIMISIYSVAIPESLNRTLQVLQQFLAWLLILGICVSAAGSFRRERETGVLELLLVSPVTEKQIIGGRLRGLWGQFLPALTVLLVLWIYFGSFSQHEIDLSYVLFFGVAFFTLPVMGLYFSLGRSGFVSAFLFTIFVGLILPAGLRAALAFSGPLLFGDTAYAIGDMADVFEGLPRMFLKLVGSISFITLWQMVAAVVLWRRLYSDLAGRNFKFEKAVT